MSLCTARTTFDTHLLVLESQCAPIRCIAFNDDDCGGQRSRVFLDTTELGEPYYVAVFGLRDDERGDVELSVYEGVFAVVEHNADVNYFVGFCTISVGVWVCVCAHVWEWVFMWVGVCVCG